MPSHRGRDRTPDNSYGDPRGRFLASLKEASIDQRIGNQVLTVFDSLPEKVSLEGDPIEWLIPGAFAFAMAQKISSGEPKIPMMKLLKAVSLSVPNFYTRVKKWIEISSLPASLREMISQSERYFQISRMIFERYDQMFLSIFNDPLDPEIPSSSTSEKTISLRRKQKVIATTKVVQPIDLYIFIWDLFVRVRRSATVVRDDLVVCYHLLMCTMDCVCNNMLSLQRPELRNPACSVLPPLPLNEELPDEEPADAQAFSLLPYLCSTFDGIYRDCQTLYVNGFTPVMEQLIKDKELTADRSSFLGLITPENYDRNYNNVNSTYGELIRVGAAADERVFLVSEDVANPGISGDPSSTMDVMDIMRERRRYAPSRVRKMESAAYRSPTPVAMNSQSSLSAPLTPTSSCSALERRDAQESQKSPALRTAMDLVTRLTNMSNGCTNAPSLNLTSILLLLYEKDVSAEFTQRASNYREMLVKAYINVDASGLGEPYIRQRFIFAEIWYFKLLEDVLVSEKNRMPLNVSRMKKLADSEKFHKAAFALAIEIILFSYNCSKMFPWPLDILDVTPYHFMKMIEPVVHLEPLPRSLVKHLGSIEESILEQLVWKSDSPVWSEIATEVVLPVREVCWPHALEETPTNPQATPLEPIMSPQGWSSHNRRKEGRLLSTVQQSSPPPPPAAIKSEPVSDPPIITESSGEPSAVTSSTDSAVASTEDSAPVISADANVDADTTAEPTENEPKPVAEAPLPEKPPKSTAVCLFFRKVYVLAAVRLRDICDKLGFDAEVEAKHHVFQRMFTLLEHTVTKHTDLLKDRHLDQILLCCAYVVAKLETQNGLDKSFHQIMHAYRYQPQAESRVYRNVLIKTQPANMPDTRRRSQTASTSSDTDTGGDREVRADIITFYNAVFVRAVQNFIAKFSPKRKAGTPGVVLSPVPRINGSIVRRQVHPRASVYVSPLKHEVVDLTPPVPGGRVLTFTFGVSGGTEPPLAESSFMTPTSSPQKGGKRPLDGEQPKRIKRTVSGKPQAKMRTPNLSAVSLQNMLPLVVNDDALAEPSNASDLTGFDCGFDFGSNPLEGIPPALPST